MKDWAMLGLAIVWPALCFTIALWVYPLLWWAGVTWLFNGLWTLTKAGPLLVDMAKHGVHNDR